MRIADVRAMPASRRILLGHAVMGVGLGLRRLSLPLCVLAAVALGAWSAYHASSEHGRGFPNLIPFHSGASVGLATWSLAGVVAIVALLVALRVLAILVGALGWWVLPLEHREMLGRLSTPGSHSGRSGDPPESGAAFAVIGVPLSHR